MNFVFIIIICIFKINLASTTFLECSDDSDCEITDLKCLNNVCECPKSQVLNTEGTKCLPISIGYNADCTDDNQCVWLLGKHVCNKGKCNCDNDWRYYQGRCRKIFSLNETCTSDENCWNGYDVLAMMCKDGVCSCHDDYYLRGGYDCRPKSFDNEYCSLNSDCFGTNKLCIGSKCAPSSETNYLIKEESELEAILPSLEVFDVDCETSADCTDSNTMCYPLTQKCVCKRGYFFKSSEAGCVGELGLDVGCQNDLECGIDYSRCVDGRCYCRKSYFSLPSNGACQKPLTHDDNFCNNKERCYVYGTNVTCLNNRCLCLLSNDLDDDLVCRFNEDSGGCSSGCNSDEDCGSIKNSECIDQTCQCPQNFRLENNVCLPNIGGTCDSNKICTIENTICDVTCNCDKNYVANGTLSCLLKSNSLNSSCLINEQCSSVVKYSQCEDKICICMRGFKEINDTCLQEKVMGEVCTNAKQCHVTMSTKVQCRNGLCQCPADMRFTENMLDCFSTSVTLVSEIVLIIILVVGLLIK